MSITWILVADASRARLFQSTRRDGPLHQLYSVDNPAGRMHGRSFTTDQPPTVHESMGFARHAIEPHTTLRTRLAERFAGRLAALLERGRTRHRFQRLVLVAPPAFLGALKAACGKPLGDTLVGEIHHDFAALDPTDVHERVSHLLEAAPWAAGPVDGHAVHAHRQ